MNLKKLFLEENVGGFDLLIRAVFGILAIIALAAGLVKRSPWKWIIAGIAFAGLISSIMRHCTPYSFSGSAPQRKNRIPVKEANLMNNIFGDIKSPISFSTGLHWN
jgi:hypothetical protein